MNEYLVNLWCRVPSFTTYGIELKIIENGTASTVLHIERFYDFFFFAVRKEDDPNTQRHEEAI